MHIQPEGSSCSSYVQGEDLKYIQKPVGGFVPKGEKSKGDGGVQRDTKK